ncbi:hypothetical protein BDV30DRAFT_209670 [Aspergillus minisclerotigenes]|uniref:Uncharacterized protein n=1 Tax=Aspergillus minisclerotigenes TaxID=656917 RepID=A0A5N6J5T3_9EURO|nr:hypothetical protein BDV30DRAFT_209670 [Aspergillus minisclerotigenes]
MGLQRFHRLPWKYEPTPIKSHVTSPFQRHHVRCERYSKPKYRGAIGFIQPAISGIARLLIWQLGLLIGVSARALRRPSSEPCHTITMRP